MADNPYTLPKGCDARKVYESIGFHRAMLMHALNYDDIEKVRSSVEAVRVDMDRTMDELRAIWDSDN